MKDDEISMDEKVEDPIENIEESIKEVKINPSDIRFYGESMSETIGELAAALSKAQGGMSNGAKEKQGYGYKYMELGVLTDIIRPQIAANGLAVIQSHELNRGNNKPSVLVHTTLMHSSGEWHKSSLDIPIVFMKQLSQAQMMGVSMTYGRRYALQSLFMIASEEDTDGKLKNN